MSITSGNLNFGNGGSSGARFSSTRGRINGSARGVNYPSPFFDVAHTYLPTTVKSMFKWCRYYFLTNPLINATIVKMAEYPVTDLVVEHEDNEVRSKWTEYLQDTLRWRPRQIECNLDYQCYGNSMTSLGFPFRKHLKCSKCGLAERADKLRQHWIFTNNTFRLTCPKCGTTGEARATDIYYKNAAGINLIRWNCEHVDIKYNDLTGESTYFYTIPRAVRNDLAIGKKDAVESVPQIFIQSMRMNKGVTFNGDNFFHMKRATLAQADRGWGVPIQMPVLKDTFYLQLMKKSQEAILLEHIVPLRILFPQAGSGSSDPYTTIDLTMWRDYVAEEVARWRLDQNYIPIMPLPLGQQTVGGDGRALLLTPEMQALSDQIIAGMGAPREFVYGGLTYTGSNVSMRMLENSFLNNILRQKQMVNWAVQKIGAFMDWPVPTIRFKPFKMADDIQRKAYNFQLNAAQKLSDTTLLSDSDFDQKKEDELMLQETALRLEASKTQQLAMANIQGEAQVVMAKAQAKAQQVSMEAQQQGKAPGEPGAATVPQGMQSPLSASQDMSGGLQPSQEQGGAQRAGMSLEDLAGSLAQQYMQLPQEQQQMAMENLRQQSPELAQMVEQLVGQMQQQQQAQGGVPGAAGAAVQQVDMRPLPDQRPPRRAAAIV